MKLGTFWCVLVVVTRSSADQWRWPEAASVRIDTKIGFIENDHTNKQNQAKRQDDDVPFHEPSETEGFYNRPPGSGKYPVRVEGRRNQAYRVDGHAIYPLKNGQKQYASNNYDGTVDTLQYCKCVNTPECNPHPSSEAACGLGRYLCCFKRPNKVTQQNTEFFNEVEDERPMLLPGRENLARPFPPPPGSEVTGFFGPIGHPNDNSHPPFNKQQQGVLVGPEGPTGVVGPQSKPDVLVGPGGPTGIIGPAQTNDDGRRSSTRWKKGKKNTKNSHPVFNVVENELAMLLPSHENLVGPFPPPQPYNFNAFFAPLGPGSNNAHIGVYDEQQGVLVVPNLPKDNVGPQPNPMFVPASIERIRRDSTDSSTDNIKSEGISSISRFSSKDPSTPERPVRSSKRKKTSLEDKNCTLEIDH
ncbi:unnamed protein product [Arctia plantaginis]|uniref:Uncharacterized protein n=1 Tax=Arctia plantaginis TaxID=874455 RepID=A0A8S1B8H2_ARCPL|nr:unnamed protein product [Arctia plantaginis]